MAGPSGSGRGDDDLVQKVEEAIDHPHLTDTEKRNLVDRLIIAVGSVLSWGALLLVATIILQVVLRYGFRHGLVILEELQWHLYAVGVMFGLSYAQVMDNHIRVDILHMQLSERTRRIIEIVGIVVLLLPFCWVVFSHSLDFLADSWRVNERSDAPLGLCCRWAIKAVIPLSIGLLALAAFSRIFHDLVALRRDAGNRGKESRHGGQ